MCVIIVGILYKQQKLHHDDIQIQNYSIHIHMSKSDSQMYSYNKQITISIESV